MEFIFDDFVYVWAANSESARIFFGAPPDWPCEVAEIDKQGRTLYKLKSEGLRVGLPRN